MFAGETIKDSLPKLGISEITHFRLRGSGLIDGAEYPRGQQPWPFLLLATRPHFKAPGAGHQVRQGGQLLFEVVRWLNSGLLRPLASRVVAFDRSPY